MPRPADTPLKEGNGGHDGKKKVLQINAEPLIVNLKEMRSYLLFNLSASIFM